MRKWLMGCAVLLAVTSAFAAEPIVNYQVLFSPDDKVAEELITLIDKENKSIRAAVYCLMHRGIANALTRAHERGVDVEVIVDPYSVKAKSPVKKMQLPIFVWDPPVAEKTSKGGKKIKSRKSLMHDKFCVLGDSRVWTGSFNFTLEGTRSNRENVIVLESAEVAGQYLEEFERLKRAGCVTLGDYLAPM